MTACCYCVAFHRGLKLTVVSDYAQTCILEDGRGWHLHLTRAAGLLKNIDDDPFGLYLCVEDMDALADAVRDLIIKAGAPYSKPGGRSRSP